MRKNEIIGLCIVVGIFAGVVSFLTLKDIIIAPQAIDVIILFVLVLVTIIYTKRASDIAVATKKQVHAAREQKYAECLHLLVPDMTEMSIINKKLEPNEIYYGIL